MAYQDAKKRTGGPVAKWAQGIVIEGRLLSIRTGKPYQGNNVADRLATIKRADGTDVTIALKAQLENFFADNDIQIGDQLYILCNGKLPGKNGFFWDFSFKFERATPVAYAQPPAQCVPPQPHPQYMPAPVPAYVPSQAAYVPSQVPPAPQAAPLTPIPAYSEYDMLVAKLREKNGDSATNTMLTMLERLPAEQRIQALRDTLKAQGVAV